MSKETLDFVPPLPPKNNKISSAFSYNFKLALTDRGAAILQEKCPNIRLLNVTAGADGSYSYYGGQKVFVPACKLGGAIETTGAGDTFCACVLNYVLKHGLDGLTISNLTEMLHFANTAAYLVTTRKGAIRSMPGRTEIAALL